MESLISVDFLEFAYGIELDPETGRRIESGTQKMLAVAAPALMRDDMPIAGFSAAKGEYA